MVQRIRVLRLVQKVVLSRLCDGAISDLEVYRLAERVLISVNRSGVLLKLSGQKVVPKRLRLAFSLLLAFASLVRDALRKVPIVVVKQEGNWDAVVDDAPCQ